MTAQGSPRDKGPDGKDRQGKDRQGKDPDGKGQHDLNPQGKGRQGKGQHDLNPQGKGPDDRDPKSSDPDDRDRQNSGPDNDPPAYHLPVLLQETLDALAIRPDGTYVDLTFGGGGHSRGILQRLGPKGRLFAFDQDSDARRNLPDDSRISFLPHNFRHAGRFLRLHEAIPVDGLLADLGVSSHQFDEGERGFSFRFEGEMDMRMDQRQALTAFDIVNTWPEERLHKLFEQYGEVTNARSLARTIVQVRGTLSLRTIPNFKAALKSVVKGNPNKYFAQVFQALRIEVNDELGALKEMLQQVPGLLCTGGRAAIITFHSLEDRIVKNFFKRGSFEDEDPSDPFGQRTAPPLLKAITKKPVIPGDAELRQNPRSRSAKLRVAERIHE